MAAPPWLPDDLVEDILLRLPPDDPACILRASLVCTTWSSIISRPGFRRRFHEHHRAPPVLGFLHDWDDERIPRFIPTTASSFSLAAPDRRSWRAIDCRHGRALFLSKGQGSRELLLWEPVTGAQQRVPVPAAAEKRFYIMENLLRSVPAHFTDMDTPCYAKLCRRQILRVVFPRVHQIKNQS